ncbi:MAG: DUF456 domain-containing protein [Candidatus Andersenbacteria bacterium]|nr:DUF456 domain-containing protein [Candidatus Andersenbacteria bacterium]
MSILLTLLVAALFMVGLLGAFIPAVPGVGLVYAGILLYAIVDGFSTIAISTLIWFGVVALLASGASYFGSAIATKKGGGGMRALWGTILGAIIGTVTIGPIGIFVGAFVGALVGALMEGQTPEKAMKVAVMSVAGIIGGSLIQFLLSVALIIAFLVAILG